MLWEPLVLATGHLATSIREDIQSRMHHLGVGLSADGVGSEVTHVPLEQLDWTCTLLQALVLGKWVVDTAWVDRLSNGLSASSNGTIRPPQPTCHLPTNHLAPWAHGMEWLKPIPGRKTMFQGVVCIIADEGQMGRWNDVLTFGGGMSWRYSRDSQISRSGKTDPPSLEQLVILIRPCGDGLCSVEDTAGMEDMAKRMGMTLTDELSLLQSLVEAKMIPEKVDMVQVTKDIQKILLEGSPEPKKLPRKSLGSFLDVIIGGGKVDKKEERPEPQTKKESVASILKKKRILSKIISHKPPPPAPCPYVPWEEDVVKKEEQEDQEEDPSKRYMVVEEVSDLCVIGSSSSSSSEGSVHSSMGSISSVTNFKRFVKSKGSRGKEPRKRTKVIPVYEQNSSGFGSSSRESWLDGSNGTRSSSLSMKSSSSSMRSTRYSMKWDEEEEEGDDDDDHHVNRALGYSKDSHSTGSFPESMEGSYSSRSSRDEKDPSGGGSGGGIMSTSTSSLLSTTSSTSITSTSTVAFG
ncbi:hypothetical protein BJ684DRAFT_18017, partial [Piptocephalis cylindrospora]